jgi:hypothetical protein
MDVGILLHTTSRDLSAGDDQVGRVRDHRAGRIAAQLGSGVRGQDVKNVACVAYRTQ